MAKSRKTVVEECKIKLLEAREDIINQLHAQRGEFSEQVTGDEGDIAQVLQSQNSSISHRENMVARLREIDEALGRIEDGSYGVCEETEEEIENDRLLAIPWTRLSIEGAQMRESTRKRYG